MQLGEVSGQAPSQSKYCHLDLYANPKGTLTSAEICPTRVFKTYHIVRVRFHELCQGLAGTASPGGRDECDSDLESGIIDGGRSEGYRLMLPV